MKKFNLRQQLALLAQGWPRPSGELVFFVEDDHVWLHKIKLPESARGTGTVRMAQFLALCDKAGLPVCLTADPIEEDDISLGASSNPTTFDLVKWYMRFGFSPLGPSEDGFLMERSPTSGNQNDIISSYMKNKRKDISYEEFERRWPEREYRSFKSPSP